MYEQLKTGGGYGEEGNDDKEEKAKSSGSRYRIHYFETSPIPATKTSLTAAQFFRKMARERAFKVLQHYPDDSRRRQTLDQIVQMQIRKNYLIAKNKLPNRKLTWFHPDLTYELAPVNVFGDYQSTGANFEEPESLTLGWVNRDTKIFSVWSSDESFNIGTLPLNAKVQLLKIEKDLGWALARFYSPGLEAIDPFDDDQVTFFIPMNGSFFLTTRADTDRYRYLTGDAGSRLVHVSPDKRMTASGIIKKVYSELLEKDNLFLTKDDDFHTRMRMLYTFIQSENPNAIKKTPDGYKLQAGTFLKLHSSDHLKGHSSEYLYQLTLIEFDSDIREQIKDTIRFAGDVIEIAPLVPALGGVKVGYKLLEGILLGAYANVETLIKDLYAYAEMIASISEDLHDLIVQLYSGGVRLLLRLVNVMLERIIDSFEGEVDEETLLDRLLEVVILCWEQIKASAGELWDDFSTALWHPLLSEKAHAIGVVIGFLLVEIALGFLTSGMSRALLIISQVLQIALPVLRALMHEFLEFITNERENLGNTKAEQEFDQILRNCEELVEAAIENLADEWEQFKRDRPYQLDFTIGSTLRRVRTKSGRGLLELRDFSGSLVQSYIRRETERFSHIAQSVGKNFAYAVIDKNLAAKNLEPLKVIRFQLAEVLTGIDRKIDNYQNRKFNAIYRKLFSDGSKSEAGHLLAAMFLPGLDFDTRISQHFFQNRRGRTRGTFAWAERRIKEKLKRKIAKSNSRASKLCGEMTPIRDSSGNITAIKVSLWEIDENMKNYGKVIELEFPNNGKELLPVEQIEMLEKWAKR